jgi:hypothetical protein
LIAIGSLAVAFQAHFGVNDQYLGEYGERNFQLSFSGKSQANRNPIIQPNIAPQASS